jgi:hypothetical protein
MRRPKNTVQKPGFLFVHHAGATDTRGKAERRAVNSHIMRHYVAQGKDGRKNRTDSKQKPLPRIMQFYLVNGDGQQPGLRLPQAVAANAFDPFDSLAAEKQNDTALILSSLFEPIKHDTIFFSGPIRTSVVSMAIIGTLLWAMPPPTTSSAPCS